MLDQRNIVQIYQILISTTPFRKNLSLCKEHEEEEEIEITCMDHQKCQAEEKQSDGVVCFLLLQAGQKQDKLAHFLCFVFVLNRFNQLDFTTTKNMKPFYSRLPTILRDVSLPPVSCIHRCSKNLKFRVGSDIAFLEKNKKSEI